MSFEAAIRNVFDHTTDQTNVRSRCQGVVLKNLEARFTRLARRQKSRSDDFIIWNVVAQLTAHNVTRRPPETTKLQGLSISVPDLPIFSLTMMGRLFR